MKINRNAKREAKQLLHFCLANGSLDENRVRQVARSVLAAGHRECPAILAHFLRLVKLDCARHMATIESATPLPADLQTVVQNQLTRRYGPGLTTVFAHRPELIGGMRIQVGCDVYDGSVRAGLEALEESFLNEGIYG
jgi:F-type H+-transporting ATPase subunit delta